MGSAGAAFVQGMRRGLLLTGACAVALACVGGSSHAATAGPALTVNAKLDRHPISPYIYGMNFADSALADELDLPVDRWGGNTAERYNWKLDVWNTGSDYFFENIAGCFNDAESFCATPPANPETRYRLFVDKDRDAGAKTLITLPLLGYVSTDPTYTHPFHCGFSVAKYGAQDSVDPFDTNCGDGRQSGVPITGNDPADTSVVSTPADQAEWVKDAADFYGDAANGGVKFYELGNEPNLWNSTHRDVHPGPTTFDEIWSKTEDMAVAVKGADPTAKVLGFSEWGWPNYFCSATDDTSNGCQSTDSDRANHGGKELAAWFLEQAYDYDLANSQRLIDYMDVHYYAQDAVDGNETEITRSLWDPTYTDPSWINDEIALIPRMKQWVAENYPGTKISLSEYNMTAGAFTTTNAQKTLIEADTLGIFAREGLDLATMWGPPTASDLVADAFRVYRNYDGNHSKFGDTWVRASSADQSDLAVYAARRSADGALTLLAINKTTGDLTSPLNLSGASVAGPAKVFRWTGSGISQIPNQPVSASGFTTTFPASSMTLFVIPTKQIEINEIYFDSPGADTGSKKSLNGEWIRLVNTTTTNKSLKNWTIRDSSGTIYRFGAYTLRGGKAVKIHTGPGSNSSSDRYWGRSAYVWGNSKDSAKLRNASGATMDTCSYSGGGPFKPC